MAIRVGRRGPRSSPRLWLQKLEDRTVLSPVLYGDDGEGRLFTLDVPTGATHVVGTMSALMYDIAFDRNGNLFGVDGTSTLYHVDPNTAATTPIGYVGAAVNALVFSRDGTLYAAGTYDSNLYTIDPTTGRGTQIGSTAPYYSAGDLAFDGEGNLYLSTTANLFARVEPTSASARLIGSIGFSNVLGLAFGPDGVMYGLSDSSQQVFSINLSTGAGTLVANFGGQGVYGAYGSSFYGEAKPVADLSIAMTNNATSVHSGQQTTFDITVTNFGPNDVTGAQIDDTLPATLTAASWTSSVAGNAQVSATSGNGDIHVSANLPVHGSVTFSLTTTVSSLATGTIANMATVAAPPGVIDPIAPNNSATTSLTITGSVGNVTGLHFSGLDSNRLDLQWDAVSGVDGYDIRRSTDGVNYTLVSIDVGTSFDDTNVSPLGEYYYHVTAVRGSAESSTPATIFAAAPSATPLPVPWSHQDIDSAGDRVGGPGAAGLTNGTFTVVGSGRDIYGTSDTFHFVGQQLIGDGSITARVLAQQDTAPWSKVGVMIRETLQADSKHAMIVVTPRNGVAFQWRAATGGYSDNANTLGPVAAYWVRLVRSGNTLTGYASPDGTTWTQIGTATIPMAATVEAGLVVLSGKNTMLNTSTFDNISVVQAGSEVSADLVVTLTDNRRTVSPGGVTTYTLVARNNGPSAVTGAGVQFGVSPLAGNITWTSVAAGGATGNSPSGVGAIGNAVDMPNGASVTYTIVVTVPAGAAGVLTATATATTPAGTTDPVSTNNTVVDVDHVASGGPAYAAGTGRGTPASVHLYDAVTGELRLSIPPYGTFAGGVRVALADFNGDGFPDVVTAPGPGGGPHIRLFDGTNGRVLREFMAFDPSFTGGVFVAVGDVNRDGIPDIITGADAGGGPHVKVFSGVDGTVLYSFFSYGPTFTGGVRVASADINGDGYADIITAAGAGGGPHVEVFSGANLSVLTSFYAYAPTFTGGVFVAADDFNGDGHADIITAPGAGGGPHVRVFSGVDEHELAGFMAYGSTFSGGVAVAVADVDGDGKADIITGANSGGGPHFRVFVHVASGLQGQRGFYAYDPSFLGGIFVGGN